MTIVTYEHHGKEVKVQEHLKGRHREHCLCYTCVEFKPEDREANCPIANALYAICVEHNVATPVWECPKFAEVK